MTDRNLKFNLLEKKTVRAFINLLIFIAIIFLGYDLVSYLGVNFEASIVALIIAGIGGFGVFGYWIWLEYPR